ncbi:MAG: hypothetical protein JXB13_19715 [Phycisphaerae bacterium]|nr:hypothetical protein [Phycisphaerae bacterium]
MHAHKPSGWNTWDYRGFNRLVFLRNGQTKIAVQYALWDGAFQPKPEERDHYRFHGGLHQNLRWDHARKIGAHASLGLPAEVEFAVGEARFRARAVAEGDALRLTVEPLGETPLRVVFLFVSPDAEPATAKSPTQGAFAGWQVGLGGATWPTDYFLNLPVPYAIGQPGQPAVLTVAPAGSSKTADTPEGPESYESVRLAGGGALADAPQAMMQAVNWNTHFDVRRRLVSSPVSRDWCIDWHGPIVFGWDTFFAATIASLESRELARLNLESVLAGVDELGFVPNYFMAHGAASRDRSMPCLGAYTIWKLEQAEPDLDWIGRMYPRLRTWHRFWMKNRNGKGDGLLAWGSNATPPYEFPQLLPYNPSLQHTAKCAMYESGLDNSPMYDDVPFNTQSNTFELEDVLLSSYYAMDCEALAWIAAALGRDKDAAAYRREHEAMKKRMNDVLWDEANGLYSNRHWDGRFSNRWAPVSFFPMIAGVPSRQQAQRMVREHLLNEREFWGEYVVPAISRSDPAYKDNDYWRGRIWGPFNYLLAEGLRRYRFDDEAAELARRGLAMFLKNWQEDGGVYENYNADTGKGADVWNAARLYHWGGLLAFIGIGELVDSEPSGHLRFGSLRFPAATVRNYRLAGHVYDVDCGDAGLRITRDGRPYLACTTRAIVRLPLAGDGPVDIRAAGPGELTVHDEAFARRPGRINDGGAIGSERRDGTVVFRWAGT